MGALYYSVSTARTAENRVKVRVERQEGAGA